MSPLSRTQPAWCFNGATRIHACQVSQPIWFGFNGATSQAEQARVGLPVPDRRRLRQLLKVLMELFEIGAFVTERFEDDCQSASFRLPRCARNCPFLSEPCRVSLPAFGAVSIEDRPKWHFRFAEKLNGLAFLRFLKQLVTFNRGRKIFLILDNIGFHHARIVREWVDDHRDQIELHFLPPYSPELNAVDYV